MKVLSGLLLLCTALLLNADEFTVLAFPVEDHAIKLDGKLDENAWKQAPEKGKFIRVFASSKELPGQTTVKVLYSKKALYIGITAKTEKGFKALPQNGP